MDTRVGIIIPTFNRSEFLIRQLKYYANTRCPHTIYIGDSSSQDHAKNVQGEIKKFSKDINIKYLYCPEFNIKQCTLSLLKMVEEKYTTYIGDDDFQIPHSITRCAEFLETNDDYASAHGCAVAIRIGNNTVYGKINKIKDYPQPAINDNSAQERILNFFNSYFPTFFSIVRTEDMKQSYLNSFEITDRSFSEEILPSALTIVGGKSKFIDCLGFVRQIHNAHHELPNTFQWIIRDDWHKSYIVFENILSSALSSQDNISLDVAKKIIQKAFWIYLKKQLPKEYFEIYPDTNKKIGFKEKIATTFPFLKPIYKKIRPMISKKRWLHAEVINSQSQFYHDFKIIREVIEGKSS